MKSAPDCIFCKIVKGEIPCTKVFEDDIVLVFMDIAPLGKGHLLAVPKEHFENIVDITPQLYGRLSSLICSLAKAVQATLAPDGMNVLQLNGKAANQVVPHLHMHLVPRWMGDGLAISEWTPVMGDAREIAETAELIKSKLSV